MYVVANILTLYRMERLRMVSRGLETLKKYQTVYIWAKKLILGYYLIDLWRHSNVNNNNNNNNNNKQQQTNNKQHGVIALWRDMTYVIWIKAVPVVVNCLHNAQQLCASFLHLA